ncbi:unnamed protein product [Miscanthus lutarioriparius]|uniref:Uncharacterized protein n=1 Tax=Miscanthus lutarioriparius TaxID=422564 RepID=A0A811MCP5_9POAL|nr:unnamed protein product [Miscanthus lutarioriparius]
MACVSAWSASAVDMGSDADGTVGTRVPDVPTIGSNTADCGTAEADTPVVGAAEEGGTVVDESPDVAMVSDTRLVRRRDLLRRKYGGDRGARERVRVRPTGAVIVIAAARGDDEQEDAGRPRRMGDDMRYRIGRLTPRLPEPVLQRQIRSYVLLELDNLLKNVGYALDRFQLPQPDDDTSAVLENRLILDELSYGSDGTAELAIQQIAHLNPDQWLIYDTIQHSVTVHSVSVALGQTENVSRFHLRITYTICSFYNHSYCILHACNVTPSVPADGGNEPENEDVGDEYREFDVEDPNCQQEFLEDVDGGKSNLIPFDAC